MTAVPLRADALAFLFAHEFAPRLMDPAEFGDIFRQPCEHPIRLPLSDRVAERDEAAVEVVYAALADLAALGHLALRIRPVERVLGQRWLVRWARLVGLPDRDLLLSRRTPLPAGPLYDALATALDRLRVTPETGYELTAGRAVRLLLKQHSETRDPHTDVLDWLGEVLLTAGLVIVPQSADGPPVARPDPERVAAYRPELEALQARLAQFAAAAPEESELLHRVVEQTMREVGILRARRHTF